MPIPPPGSASTTVGSTTTGRKSYTIGVGSGSGGRSRDNCRDNFICVQSKDPDSSDNTKRASASHAEDRVPVRRHRRIDGAGGKMRLRHQSERAGSLADSPRWGRNPRLVADDKV